MANISILDCTLRDGGYINQWRFGRDNIRSIVRHLEDAGLDIIECGFLRDVPVDEDVAVFSELDSISTIISPKQTGTMYVAMLEYGKLPIERIPERGQHSVDGIRMTFHKQDKDHAIAAYQQLIEKGYIVFVQPVGTTAYSDEELLSLVNDINTLNPYAFYLVDTLGVMYAKDLLRQFFLVDHNLKPGIRVGLHSHNNLQMSFANAQELIKRSGARKIIIDSSVYGMGRGAGNLPTELITHYINEQNGNRYQILPILYIADKYLLSIYYTQRWGYDLPYYLSATENCHPNYASYLMRKQTLDVNSIAQLLGMIPQENKEWFNQELIEKIYLRYQDYNIDDSRAIEDICDAFKNTSVLILGAGPTLKTEESNIRAYIEKNNPLVIGVNFYSHSYGADWVFISNKKRISTLNTQASSNINIIATSNITEKITAKKTIKVNYTSYLGEGEEADNSGAMLIRLLRKVRVHHIVIAGFDGYDEAGGANYYVDDYKRIINSIDAKKKNENISRQLRNALGTCSYEFLTTTRYHK